MLTLFLWVTFYFTFNFFSFHLNILVYHQILYTIFYWQFKEFRVFNSRCPQNWLFVVAQLVKNPPAMRETWVWSLGQIHPLKKGKATHSSILARRIPWTVQFLGLQRVRHDWVTFSSLLAQLSFRKSLNKLKTCIQGASLVVQWLRLHVPNTGGLGLTPGQGTRSHMPELNISHASTKDPYAATMIEAPPCCS